MSGNTNVDWSKIKVLDLDAHLGKVKNKISLVGVELEGGWATLPKGITQLVDDGSVFGRRIPPGAKAIGELPIGPIVPAAIPEEMRKYYPSHVNKTCGMHVHMSFESLWHYKLLMVPEYQKTVLEYFTRWAKEQGSKIFPEKHCIWERLRGDSRYCQNQFWPDAQSIVTRKDHDQNRHGHRYTVIHYCGRTRTVECRVLPMMERYKTGLAAVQHLLNITNACIYLLGTKQPRDKQVGKIEFADGMVYEETIITELS